jgi:hypothetical protein
VKPVWKKEGKNLTPCKLWFLCYQHEHDKI